VARLQPAAVAAAGRGRAAGARRGAQRGNRAAGGGVCWPLLTATPVFLNFVLRLFWDDRLRSVSYTVMVMINWLNLHAVCSYLNICACRSR
jgi:hypothetical protein